jgi:hypothetical protein
MKPTDDLDLGPIKRSTVMMKTAVTATIEYVKGLAASWGFGLELRDIADRYAYHSQEEQHRALMQAIEDFGRKLDTAEQQPVSSAGVEEPVALVA